MDNKLKHLEFIQGVVNRLSTNSFLLKGWSVVLVSALFALSAASAKPAFIFLAYIPAFVFWGLDGYFLMLEKLYRKLYDEVRGKDENTIDFSMGVGHLGGGFESWARAVFSRTLIPFHGCLIAAILVVMFLQV